MEDIREIIPPLLSQEMFADSYRILMAYSYFVDSLFVIILLLLGLQGTLFTIGNRSCHSGLFDAVGLIDYAKGSRKKDRNL